MNLIMGIGNPFRGDDAAGLLVARRLRTRVKTVLCETDPLDYIEEICQNKPERLIIIDAINAGEKPGKIIHVDINSVDNLSLSTHHFPISLFLKFIKKCVKKIEIWGIQVKNVEFGADMSEEVKLAVSKLTELIANKIENIEEPGI